MAHDEPYPDRHALRQRAQRFVESRRTQYAITALILINAAILGAETSPAIMEVTGSLLTTLDRIILTVFCAEVGIKLYVHGRGFFRNGWNLFDAAVISVSLIPASDGTSILRALRIIRVMRLISVVPSMRKVTQALLGAIPGMGVVVSLLLLVFYVASVMATKLFGQAFPAWFGDIGLSAFSLFQIMTLESWSMGIVRPVMEVYPYAWAFFVPFILIVTFAVLNLFIAIIVNAMHDEAQAAANAEAAEMASDTSVAGDRTRTLAALDRMESEIRALRSELGRANPPAQETSPREVSRRS